MSRSFRGVRAAVTGASGFCGGEVARRLDAAGADVVCLGRRPGPVGRHVPWDAARDAPDLAGADVVVHLAAAVGDTRGGATVEAAYRQVNVDGTRRLLDAARSRPVVWVSSASVYDPGVHRGLVHEDHPIGGQLTAYGRTKAAGERLALSAGAVVLRPRAVYGPGDRHLLPRILASVRHGRVLLPGPDVRLSLTAVENLADACLAAAYWPRGAYNIVDERPYSRDDAIAAVLAAYGVRASIAHVPVWLAMAAARVAGRRRGLTPYSVDQLAHTVVLDWSRAAAQGYQPRRTLGDFLRERGSTTPSCGAATRG
jgi:nucleoside-diphosphate-sugar epimerase